MGIVAGMASYGISQAAEGDGAADAESSAQNPITKPLGVSKDDVPPNVMFVMGRDHNLFTAAYSDYTPLTENNSADYFYTIYHPEFIYEGMFASDMCYEYQGLENPVDEDHNKAWVPTSMAMSKKASSSDGTVSADVYYCGDKKWLGNFMNYVTASRLDVIKTALYGGTRLLKSDNTQYDYTWKKDNSISPVLTHTDVLYDAHAWAKVFSPKMYVNYPKVPKIDIEEISGLPALPSFDGTRSDGTSPAYFLGVFPKEYKPSGSPRFRVVKVEKANIPGDQGKYALVKECEDGIGNCAVWTWISQESGDNKNFKANEKVGDKFVNTWATKVNDDYLLNVVACNPKLTSKINNNCKEYVSEEKQTYHQPEGIVQLYGVGPQARLHFGLLTGGWDSNRTGAMLRDNISNKDNEYDIDKNTGKIIYKTCDGKRCGLAGSLDQFKIIKNNNYYLEDCNREIGVLKAMNGAEKKCGDWGNPIAELLYESVNYFQDKKVDRDGNTSGREDNMKLGCVANTTDTNKPISTRQNPYSKSNYCAKAVSFIISDEAPSFDAFGQGSNSSIEKEDQGKITAELQKRFKVSGKYLVGLSTSTTSNNEEQHYKGMPTIKTINDLSDVVGIAPTQAFSYGSYNVVGVASLALGKDADNLPLSNSAREVKENFNMQTFVLAMKPNMPEVKIPVKNGVVRLIPLAKSPAEAGAIENKDPSNDDASRTTAYQLQSTNQVAGFYIQYSTDTEGLFHVSFEDFEYGSDFDMDWVVGYKYKVIDGTDGNQYVQITMLHEDGDVYTPQHGGYVISGVDYSGTYLDLAKSSSYYLFDEQGNFYSLDNYISDAGFYACKSESSGKNFLDCLVDPSKDLPTSMDFNGGTIVSQYEAIMNKKADVNTGEICSDASDNCRPIYYMPRYMFSRYADYYLNNGKVNNFFKFDINDIDMRLVGDRARVLKETSQVGWNGEENHAEFKKASDGNAVGITYSSRIFKVSKSDSGDVWLKSPLWYAAKAGYTFDQRDGNNNADPVNFSYVTNPAEFRKNIRKLINLLLSSYHSASSFVLQTTASTNGTAVYATSYNPMNWFGTIYKSPVDGATGSYNFAILNDLKGCWESGCEAYEQNGWWNAAYEFSKMTPENRLIVTYDNNELKRVYVSSADADNKSTLADLGLDIFGTDGIEHPTETRLKYIIRWLGGEAKHEGSIEEYEQAVATDDFNVLRERKEGERHFVLGDIVNSDVALVQAGNQFLLAVGANDGMLHILDEATGKPLVSFIPTEVRTEILRTAEVLYETNHKFFVDSTPKTFSKTIDGIVHTYLYGTLGLNFKGGYLLDLTKIFGTQNSSVEDRFEDIKDDLYGWELKSSKSNLVGQSREAPIYYSVNNKDYFIYSSGYNAVTPGVLVVQGFSDDGKKPELNVKAEILLGKEANRAISPIEIYARQSSKGLEPISMFVGDTLGRLYQIKLNGAVSGRPDCWGYVNNECSGVTITDEQATDYQPIVAFKAKDKDKDGKPQKITARPAVAALASGGYAVLFGTGSYWTPFDDTPDSLKQVQTMYCLNRDNGSSTGTNTMDRSMLMPIKHVGDNTCKRNKLNGYAEGECTGNWLASTTSADKPKLKNGWYMDLNAFSGKEAKDLTGERIYRSPLVINKTVYVVSAIPNVSDSCETGGRSYLYTMNVDNGTTVLQQEIKGLANEMVATVHDGQLIVQVPYDGSGDKNTESGVAAIAIPDMRTPNMRRSSWIRLY